MPNYPTLVLQI